MNSILEAYARQWLKEHIIFCHKKEIKIFMRMYKVNPDAGLITTIETMSVNKLDHAMFQVYQTLIQRKYL